MQHISLLALIFFMPTTALAQSSSCVSSFGNMTTYMEAAASASANGDACGTADNIKYAMNAAGDAIEACEGTQLATAQRYAAGLGSQLAKAVSLCGH